MGTGRRTILRADRMITPEGLAEQGWVVVEGESIVGVGSGDLVLGLGLDADIELLGDVTLVPGFVDVHGHGGGGAAFTEGEEAARTAIATHRAHGTTSLMASLVTDTIDALESQVRALRGLVGADELVGVHLEGPWLSDRHCGAHAPELLRDPDLADVARLVEAGEGSVRMVTLAPERPGGMAAVSWLAAHGVLAAVGHSHASYETALTAVDAGARVATHLFNASRPIHHRDPGLILALLERPEVVVELVADGVHLHPSLVRWAANAKPGAFVLITDAMAAAGAADGDYLLGPLLVQVREGVARLAEGGSIAGSTLTMDRALRHAVYEVGIALPDAVRAASTTPADLIGRPDLGRIATGARADLVVLDDALRVARVMRRGSWLPQG